MAAAAGHEPERLPRHGHDLPRGERARLLGDVRGEPRPPAPALRRGRRQNRGHVSGGLASAAGGLGSAAGCPPTPARARPRVRRRSDRRADGRG
eukprot:1895830-Prymnesium_polylepis.2